MRIPDNFEGLPSRADVHGTLALGARTPLTMDLALATMTQGLAVAGATSGQAAPIGHVFALCYR